MAEPGNVDHRETEKFGQPWEVWWDPRGPMHSLHDINPLRLAFITQAVAVADRRMVDVGCGGGILTESLAQLGAHVTGIDLSEPLSELARSHAAERGLQVDYRLESVEQLAENQPESYDIVTCLEVLEHIPNPEAVVAACSRLLKPGGHAFFATINRTLKSLLMVIVGAEYILGLLPRGSHTYGKLIRPVELKAWARKDDLVFVGSASVTYNPLTAKFGVIPREDMSYMTHFTRR
jgi:2-polyprenyl-6-hydroxyphenyl methylase/3-demethylubiquinone-9 3-methyltransferase